jgi:hypothetical protein
MFKINRMITLIGRVLKKQISERKAAVFLQTEHGMLRIQARSKEMILQIIPIDAFNTVSCGIEFDTSKDTTNVVLRSIKKIGA